MDFKMDHPLLGPMMHGHRDRGWCGQLRLPVFGSWRVLYDRTPCSEFEENAAPDPPSEQFTVYVDDPEREGPSAAQEAALEYLVQEQDVYAKAIQGELSRVVRLLLLEERQLHQQNPQFTLRLNRSAREFQLDRPDGITKLVELGSVYVLRQAKAGQSYLTFEFACGWDVEHGVSVLVHAGNALASDAAAEFLDLGTSNVENLVEEQRNDLVRGFNCLFDADERRRRQADIRNAGDTPGKPAG